MKIDFLIVCRSDLADAGFLRAILSETLQADYEEAAPDTLMENITLTLMRAAPDGVDDASTAYPRMICGFEVYMPIDQSNPQTIIEDFADALKDTHGIDHVLKFYDDFLLRQNLDLVREVFALEMNLRKALSIVYLAAGKEFYNLLCDDQVDVIKQGGEKPTSQHMQKLCENEFFHLTFSQYRGLNQKRPITHVSAIVNAILSANSLEDLKVKLIQPPVTNEEDNDFILSLRALLDPIDKLRNPVAHNRAPGGAIEQSYNEGKSELEAACRDFLMTFQPVNNESTEEI